MTKTSQKDIVALDQVLYIHYPIWFKKNKVQALLHSSSEVNAMIPEYVLKLDLKKWF